MNRARVLIAGLGNLFHGDDYFGCETAQRLSRRPQPVDVEVADFGIRGFDAAYALMSGYELVILVDATSQGSEPGAVYVMELASDALGESQPQTPVADAHAMSPLNVLRLVKAMGGEFPKLLLVGCEPADLGGEEGQMGLSEPVAAAVDKAIAVIESLVSDYLSGATAASERGEVAPITSVAS